VNAAEQLAKAITENYDNPLQGSTIDVRRQGNDRDVQDARRIQVSTDPVRFVATKLAITRT